IDLAGFGTTTLAGHVLRIEPPAGSEDYHFGSTVALADLDNNLRAEVLIAAALARAGAQLEADGAPPGSAIKNGGNPGGSLFIFWDDNFPAGATWPAGLVLSADAPPASFSRVDGGTVSGTFTNLRLAEEMLGGLDYDGDGTADLFVGDIRGNGRGRSESGLGHVFFDASSLRNQAFSMNAVPTAISVSTILGIAAGTISADTSLHGDFDGDGIADLGISSPLGNPLGRVHAGIVHVLWGQPGPWPAIIDLLDGSRPAGFAITDIYGARGQTSGADLGDTLMYSAAGADVNNDGKTDLVINEMRGNGVAAGALDVGNLIILGGELVPR
ncbi:MAG: hypothetical protein HKN49_05190, partial [Gammaproteobacteria bacterium]|nr:hypothetical protein [Gammaproteobacteria bacterium]NNF60876.1 hypothetical protein [Gammaproteobacteria bacterium]